MDIQRITTQLEATTFVVVAVPKAYPERVWFATNIQELDHIWSWTEYSQFATRMTQERALAVHSMVDMTVFKEAAVIGCINGVWNKLSDPSVDSND